MLAAGKSWHGDCLLCAECSHPVRIAYHGSGSRLYCTPCFARKFVARCATCATYIEGEATHVDGVYWHPVCFACNKCSEPFKEVRSLLRDSNDYRTSSTRSPASTIASAATSSCASSCARRTAACRRRPCPALVNDSSVFRV